jgi:polar amino acid transport system substrate-binding protein
MLAQRAWRGIGAAADSACGLLPAVLASRAVSGLRLARWIVAAILVALLAVVAAGCGSSNESASSTSASSCEPDQLNLVKKGQLTVATDNPAFNPWFAGGTPKGSTWKFNDPTTQKGYESAVAYAIAKRLGFTPAQVKWIVVPFEQLFKPGAKPYDFDVNQVSVTPARMKSVSFSDSYYNTNQGLVAIKGTPITKAKTLADLKKYKLGAQVGTTSYDYIVKHINPDKQPAVFNNSTDVNSGLKTGGIDGIVVDLPTAFIIVGAEEVPNSVVVGSFPTKGGGDHFGAVFSKGNSLVKCVNQALATLKSNGTLAQLQDKWISNAGAPVLK